LEHNNTVQSDWGTRVELRKNRLYSKNCVLTTQFSVKRKKILLVLKILAKKIIQSLKEKHADIQLYKKKSY
jgi:hypothetical protein